MNPVNVASHQTGMKMRLQQQQFCGDASSGRTKPTLSCACWLHFFVFHTPFQLCNARTKVQNNNQKLKTAAKWHLNSNWHRIVLT